MRLPSLTSCWLKKMLNKRRSGNVYCCIKAGSPFSSSSRISCNSVLEKCQFRNWVEAQKLAAMIVSLLLFVEHLSSRI